MSVKLEIGDYERRTEEIRKEVSSIYLQYEKQEAADSLTSALKDIKSEDKICLSFVGQYSAGKSTIIKALTNNSEILIDSDIATSKVTPYEWGSILLIDTPGLNTNENAEHDELTQEAIKKSHLLVYCITSDLFRPVTRQDFISLAEQYRDKLFLVINKMNKENGEYEDLVENYTKSINDTINPFSLEQFHHFFFDAADYIEGVAENDEDFIYDSHFLLFIEELNKFIELKGLKGKMLVPLDILQDSLDTQLNEIETDEHIQEENKLISRICKAVKEKKRSFITSSIDEVQKVAHKFIQKGDEIALHMDEKGFSFDNQNFQDFSEPIHDGLCKRITEEFEEYAKEADEEVKRILKSELATHFFKEEENQRLDKKIKGSSRKDSDAFSNIEKGIGEVATKAVPKVNSVFAKLANISDGKKITLWSVRGSDLHNIVKNVGRKLGHKFKPFEALQISKKIAGLNKWIAPVLTGAGTVFQLAGIFAEKLGEKQQENKKREIRALFRGISEETEKYYREQINSASEEFERIIGDLENQLLLNQKRNESNSELSKQLSKLKDRVLKLKAEIK